MVVSLLYFCSIPARCLFHCLWYSNTGSVSSLASLTIMVSCSCNTSFKVAFPYSSLQLHVSLLITPIVTSFCASIPRVAFRFSQSGFYWLPSVYWGSYPILVASACPIYHLSSRSGCLCLLIGSVPSFRGICRSFLSLSVRFSSS